MNAIEIRGLTKKFKDLTAVDNLSLDIRKGELFALLGVNGAGKTTTIRMLCGLLKPDAGDAIMDGLSLNRDGQKIKLINNVSPQETAVARNLTVRENLEMMAGIYGADKTQAKQKATEIIEKFSLTQFEKKRAKTLSGGWQRRLSIAMALISEPKILFLDEPTLGLDVLARRELWGAIEALKGHVTVILTTHYMEETESLSDRVGVMANGKLLTVGTASELIEKTGAKDFENAFVAIATGKGVA